MRCKNCGWPNEDGITRCIKCNAPLMGSMIESNTPRQAPATPENLKSTVREAYSDASYIDNPSKHDQPTPANDANNANTAPAGTCPSCGYPVGNGATQCPMCHTIIATSTPQPHHNQQQPKYQNITPQPQNHNSGNRFAGTVNPWMSPDNGDAAFCTLQRIPWQTERVNYEPVSYSGAEIILNRANTDPNNNSITSREQAVITNEGGQWYIENKSDMKTTLLRVDRKTQLQDGDIIVMGNRMFEFRKG